MKEKLKNAQMAEMLRQLRPLLSHKDMIGYIAARNYRRLSEALTEYQAVRSGLIEKYGEDFMDENGEPVFGLKFNSPNFKSFCDEMQAFNEIEHEVEIMKGKYTDAVGCLTGEEILSIDWMLED